VVTEERVHRGMTDRLRIKPFGQLFGYPDHDWSWTMDHKLWTT